VSANICMCLHVYVFVCADALFHSLSHAQTKAITAFASCSNLSFSPSKVIRYVNERITAG